MKTQRNILVAFLLNLSFSIFEFFGGIFTGSVAIMSDAVHDLGDAASIGISFFLEKKSTKRPDEKYTYGYARFSVLGSVITTFILLFGSAAVIYNAVARLISPTKINYDGMIIFAVVGVAVNFAAALFTRKGDSLNQKAVNLHMLEDVLGWAVVLVGAVIMRFTDFSLIDPIMSICVSVFIFVNALKGLKEATEVFLEKTPHEIDTHELTEHLCELDGVLDIHHVHVWSMDGSGHCATLHAVVTPKKDTHSIKEAIRKELAEHGIGHVTIELESEGESCHEKECHTESHSSHGHHHHHHHHHHH